jgi:hypothetical protein
MNRPALQSSSYFILLAALIGGAFIFFGLPAGAPVKNHKGLVVSPQAASQRTPASLPSRVKAQEALAGLPMSFIQNQGQVAEDIKFYEKRGGQVVYFTPQEVVFSLEPGTGKAGLLEAPGDSAKPALVRLGPLGLQQGVKLEAADPLPGRVNYFIGNDPQKWRTNIPTYRAVAFRNAYPGIDLKFYGTGRQLEYDVIVQPGADPTQVRFKYAGIKGLKVTPQGDLALALPGGGELIQKKPVIYQEIGGQRVAREGKFRVDRDHAGLVYGFEVAAYDQNHPLVIDPVMLFSTYLGAGSLDGAEAIALDAADNVYLTGITSSPDLGTTGGAFQSGYQGGTYDAFVAKINPQTHTLIYQTYLGGSGEDWGYAIAVDAQGNAHVGGKTNSANFPLKNAVKTKVGSDFDAYVAKLNPSGSGLVYSTLLGGDQETAARGIGLDSKGNAFVAGYSYSSILPTTTGVIGKNLKGTMNAFVGKLPPSGKPLTYLTYLGGTKEDGAYGLAVDAAGNAYVTGATVSLDFPTTPGVKYPTYPNTLCGAAAFVSKIAPGGKNLLYSTYLGGTDPSGITQGFAIAVDGGGNAYVTGQTSQNDFPCSVSALCVLLLDDPNTPECSRKSAFVTKLNVGATDLLYSTYLGGSDYDVGLGIAVDPENSVYVAGYTYSGNDFQILDGLCAFNNGTGTGNHDAFVTKLVYHSQTGGYGLAYSTFLGGWANDLANGIAVNSYKEAYAAGAAGSDDFPTLNPLQAQNNGDFDTFVTKIGDQQTYSFWLPLYINPKKFKILQDPGHPDATVPIAILSTPDFDANQINPATVGLSGGLVKMKSRGRPKFILRDVNRDGRKDLVVYISKKGMPGGAPASLSVTGRTYAGECFQATLLE